MCQLRDYCDPSHENLIRGLFARITQHLKNLQYIFDLYKKFKGEPTMKFPDSIVNYTVVYSPQYYPGNLQKNNWLNILKTTQAIEAGIYWAPFR